MGSAFLIVMLVFTLALFTITRLAAERIARHHYEQKADFFAHHLVQPEDIVFLGDSITDGACWDELFPGYSVKNRGINADTVGGVLNRLGETLCCHPAAIFILIGTNDLPWYMNHNSSDILETYRSILKRCRAESPSTRVFVQSILPRHPSYAGRIRAINASMADLAAQFGYTYIDLFTPFAGADGGLRSDFTNDRLHLMAAGYACWVEILLPYMETLPVSHQPGN